MGLFGRFLALASGLLTMYFFLDFMVSLFTGDTIGSIIAGNNGQVVSLIIEKIPYLSPAVFVLVNILALLVLSFLMTLCFWIAVKPSMEGSE